VERHLTTERIVFRSSPRTLAGDQMDGAFWESIMRIAWFFSIGPVTLPFGATLKPLGLKEWRLWPGRRRREATFSRWPSA